VPESGESLSPSGDVYPLSGEEVPESGELYPLSGEEDPESGASMMVNVFCMELCAVQ
jgi:hypothetical protein